MDCQTGKPLQARHNYIIYDLNHKRDVYNSISVFSYTTIIYDDLSQASLHISLVARRLGKQGGKPTSSLSGPRRNRGTFLGEGKLEGLFKGRLPCSVLKVVQGELNTATIAGDVIDEWCFIREVVTAHVHQGDSTRDTFHHDAITGFRHDDVD